MYLPISDAPADADNEEEKVPTASGTETILVAEDEEMVRNLAARILSDAGYSVVTASNGEEAVRLFDENRDGISLVLLDAVMPKLGGREAYHRIKEINPETKVVFCTGYDPETAQANAILEEELRLVEKPFDPAVLLRTIREVLDAELPRCKSDCGEDIVRRSRDGLAEEFANTDSISP